MIGNAVLRGASARRAGAPTRVVYVPIGSAKLFVTTGSSEIATHRVLLVHGTFAASNSSEGDAWWQQGSDFHGWLHARLNQTLGPTEVIPFHWSGANSEADRVQAGLALAAVIEGWASRSDPVHLVGHSHGGSVLWNALRFTNQGLRKHRRVADHPTVTNRDALPAISQAEPLSSLVSWTTVGTPYLRSSTQDLRAFGGRFRRALTRVIATILMMFAWVVFPLTCVALGAAVLFQVHEGVQDHYLVYVALIAVLVVSALVVFLVYPVLYSWAKRDEAVHEVRREEAASTWAWQAFGSQWLGIWDAEDEAISGLRSALQLPTGMVRPMSAFSPPGAFEVEDRYFRANRFFRAPAVSLFNRFLVNRLDRFVVDTLKSRAYGNDRSHVNVADVDTQPFGGVAPHQPLPDAISQAIYEKVEAQSTGSVSHVRKTLARVASEGFAAMGSLGEGLSGHELVHTAYFSCEPVAELIARHIELEVLSETALPDDALTQWLVSQKRASSTHQIDPG